MTKDAIQMIKPYLDATNIDLKFFRDESYRKICKGSLQPVLDSIRLMRESGIWVEVTTLVVPGLNDSEQELQGIAEFLAGVDKDMPWHISRFYPNYNMADREPTPEAALKKAEEIGRKAGLRFIYAGNVWGWGQDTLCQSCGRVLIKREGFGVQEYNIDGGACVYCRHRVPGVFAERKGDSG